MLQVVVEMPAQAAQAAPEAPDAPVREEPAADVPAAAAQVTGIPGPSPAAILEAKEEQREVLGEQLSRLLNRRESLDSELRSPSLSEAQRTAIEQHYIAINGRIIEMEKAIQVADQEWAAAAGVPGAHVREPEPPQDGVSDEAVVTGIVFCGIATVIVSIAYARRLWKGAGKVVAHIPAAFEARFTRLEQSLDAVAIEVERVSEGQRFLTRVFGEQNPRGVGAGAAQPVELAAREGAPEGYSHGR